MRMTAVQGWGNSDHMIQGDTLGPLVNFENVCGWREEKIEWRSAYTMASSRWKKLLSSII